MGAEWKRLGLFLALGTAIFLLAVVGAAFVPFRWPAALRRSAHPMVFVPLALVLTVRMVRRDAERLPCEDLFDPWPVRSRSIRWAALGVLLAGAVALTFVLAFRLRWVPNNGWSPLNAVLVLLAIVLTAAAEEIAFRGYGFWRLLRLIGFWPAQAVVAALFVVSHLTLGGYSLLPALVGNVTGSVLFGAAFVRSRGLAAPIALHASWNIWQHLFLSPLDASATPLVPTFMHATAGWQYVAMLGVIGAAMIAATVGILQSRRRFA